jgi:starch synthase
MCSLGFCEIGKIQFSFNVLKETTDKLGFGYISLKFPLFEKKKEYMDMRMILNRFLSFQIAALDNR